MQLPIHDQLLDLAVRSTPKDLFRTLAQKRDSLYEEAAAQAESGPWLPKQAKWLIPYNRRAIMEANLCTEAKRIGLKVFDLPHDRNGCEYVMVKSGKLNITCHYVNGPKQLPRFAKARKNNAAVNEWLEGHLPNSLCAPLPGLLDERTHIYILHGEQVSKNDDDEKYVNRFLRIAIPDYTGEHLQRNWDISEVLAAYEILTPLAVVEDKAEVRLKKHKKAKDVG